MLVRDSMGMKAARLVVRLLRTVPHVVYVSSILHELYPMKLPFGSCSLRTDVIRCKLGTTGFCKLGTTGFCKMTKTTVFCNMSGRGPPGSAIYPYKLICIYMYITAENLDKTLE